MLALLTGQKTVQEEVTLASRGASSVQVLGNAIARNFDHVHSKKGKQSAEITLLYDQIQMVRKCSAKEFSQKIEMVKTINKDNYEIQKKKYLLPAQHNEKTAAKVCKQAKQSVLDKLTRFVPAYLAHIKTIHELRNFHRNIYEEVLIKLNNNNIATAVSELAQLNVRTVERPPSEELSEEDKKDWTGIPDTDSLTDGDWTFLITPNSGKNI